MCMRGDRGTQWMVQQSDRFTDPGNDAERREAA
jgi:hypothetical protein